MNIILVMPSLYSFFFALSRKSKIAFLLSCTIHTELCNIENPKKRVIPGIIRSIICVFSFFCHRRFSDFVRK